MTILEAELTALDGLDKAYHPLYTQRDGKWLLTGVKGYTPEDRTSYGKALETERNNAKTYHGELKLLRPFKTLFGDKKPEDIQAQLDRVEELELASKGKLDEGELEKRVTARLEAAKKPFERKLAEATEKLTATEAKVAEYEARERRTKVHSAIREAALASGALPESYADGGGLLAVLEGVLEVTEDGKVQSKDGAGYPSGLDVAGLLKQVQTKQGYFWGTSKGGGANPGNGSRLPAGTNPWKEGSKNRTEQMRIETENPELAKQYKAAAGVLI